MTLVAVTVKVVGVNVTLVGGGGGLFHAGLIYATSEAPSNLFSLRERTLDRSVSPVPPHRNFRRAGVRRSPVPAARVATTRWEMTTTTRRDETSGV